VHRDAAVTKPGGERSRGERGGPISPKALGIAFGIWITAMLVLAFVVVPTAFGSCAPPS